MHWQSAPVDRTTERAYLDSGAPPMSDYTTIVIVHGHTFRVRGLTTLGWSLGNVFSSAFVANLNAYPPGVTRVLEPHLKSLIIYAPPSFLLGYPDPPGARNPFLSPENPKRIAPITFGAWVSSYYKHPAFSGAQRPDILTAASFTQRVLEVQYRPSTTDTISANELTEIIDMAPNGRSERFFFDVSQSLMHDLLEKAVVGVDNSPFPLLNVYFVYGQEDIWTIAWAAFEFERDLEKWRSHGQHMRPTKVLSLPGANHMVPWDDPETFLKLITKGEIPENNF